MLTPGPSQDTAYLDFPVSLGDAAHINLSTEAFDDLETIFKVPSGPFPQ